MIVHTGKTMLGLLLVVTSCVLMTGCHGNREMEGGGENGRMGVDREKVRRSVPAKSFPQRQHLLGSDLTSEQRVRRDVSNPHVPRPPKRGDWAKTNVHMWGKRHSAGLPDLLRDDDADKRSSWEKTNVRMWGKRRYDEDYEDYGWPERDVYRVYRKRESQPPSTADDVGQVVVPGWAKNAWERNNMRIWG